MNPHPTGKVPKKLNSEKQTGQGKRIKRISIFFGNSFFVVFKLAQLN